MNGDAPAALDLSVHYPLLQMLVYFDWIKLEDVANATARPPGPSNPHCCSGHDAQARLHQAMCSSCLCSTHVAKVQAPPQHRMPLPEHTMRLFACLWPRQVVDWRGPSGAADVAAAFAHFSVQGNAASGGLPYWRQAGSVSLASPSCPAGRAETLYRS